MDIRAPLHPDAHQMYLSCTPNLPTKIIPTKIA